MSNNFIIETNRLTKKYGEQVAVNDVNLHVKKGRIYGLLGRNGAGKTTIMKMMLGLTSITSGEINLFSQKLEGNERKLYPRIGSMIETPGFYPNLTGMENLQVFAKLRGTVNKNSVKEALAIVGLNYDSKKTFSAYSLGMKQRLGIANAIISDPELLILDEPTNGLDPIGIAEVRDFIKQLSHVQGKTILLSSHILTEIALIVDDIGILHDGKLLVENSLAELEGKYSKYISIQVSSIPNTIHILEKEMNISDYSVEVDDFIRIYDSSRELSAINEVLVRGGIKVSHLQMCNESLEDYFKKITGGEGIA
jgi:bacitracin transport system ATP-binding protein